MLVAAARAAARASRRGATSAQKRFSSSSSHEEEVRQMGLWRTVTFAGELEGWKWRGRRGRAVLWRTKKGSRRVRFSRAPHSPRASCLSSLGWCGATEVHREQLPAA